MVSDPAMPRPILALAIIGGWLLLALAWTPATVLVERGAGGPGPVVFLHVLTGFVPWMLATPIIFRLARRYPISPGHENRLLIHVLGGMVLLPVVSLAGRLLSYAFVLDSEWTWANLGRASLITALYSVPTYVAVAAIGQILARKRSPDTAVPEISAGYLRRLPVRERGRTQLLEARDIDYFDVAGHYLCIHVGDTVHVTRGQLRELERRLDPREFGRIHRSTIVRLDRVSALDERRNGDCDLVLSNGRRLLLSRSYRDSLRLSMGVPEL